MATGRTGLEVGHAGRLYLDLLTTVLTRSDAKEESRRVAAGGAGLKQKAKRRLLHELRERGLDVVRVSPVDPEARAEGRDWPANAATMVGLKRLANLEQCIVDVVRDGIPGDVAETGVWRGGAMIFAKAVLEVLGDTERVVWCADSFEGLPPPDPEAYPADAFDRHSTASELAVSLEEVQANFARYGLLDARVQFLKGWFRDTLPSAPIRRIAVLRLDGDMYESTIVALRSLYPKLSPGGYVIVDDYGAVAGCKEAVDDFRAEQEINDEIRAIDWTGCYWRRGV
jgi:O-methyltransferase